MSESETPAKTEQEIHTNPMLAMAVEKDSELKRYLINYVGSKLCKGDDEETPVTVHMIVEILALEFPEFVFAFAEENFLRGYQLGLDDVRLLKRSPEELEE